MNAAKYEAFIRNAFSLAFGRNVARYKDPAGLAGADRFSQDEIPAVKVAIGYAFEIYVHMIFNDLSLDLSREEFTRIKSFTNQVMATDDLSSIINITELFQKTVIDKYCMKGKAVSKINKK